MTNILLIGSGGNLGSGIIKQNSLNLSSNIKLITPSSKELDIVNPKNVMEYFTDNESKIQIVVNCAAIVNLEYCEKLPLLAKNCNHIGVQYLSYWCNYFKKPLIHISTAMVFGNTTDKPNYNDNPYLKPNIFKPLSVYAKTKLEAEKEVLKYCNNVIIRTSWLFNDKLNDDKFVSKIFRKIINNNSELNIENKSGKITSINDLSNYILELSNTICCKQRQSSRKMPAKIVHYTNSGFTDRIEIARYLAKMLNKEVKINKVSDGFYDKNIMNLRCNELLYNTVKVRGWADALKETVKGLHLNFKPTINEIKPINFAPEPIVGNLSSYLNYDME